MLETRGEEIKYWIKFGAVCIVIYAISVAGYAFYFNLLINSNLPEWAKFLLLLK